MGAEAQVTGRLGGTRTSKRAKAAQPGPSKPRGNHLAGQKSPYLLQHAGNPVDWYPWGEEAFERARREDRPVFLSIGYSTCHWCHVMAHESFEDPQVAALLNEGFVSIKVDREERPDIDAVYMQACQAMTGSGGWPLTVIMAADGRPFVATTYVPKESRFGRAGLLEMLPRLMQLWREDREGLLESAGEVVAAMVESHGSGAAGGEGAEGGEGGEGGAGGGGADLGKEALELGYLQLAQRFDADDGGFSAGPKFPTPHNLLFLLRYWRRTGDGWALRMVERTLDAMRRGGVHDHLGGGFHRYSTDSGWLLPHFEKMLYDQALIMMAYTEAYLATRDEGHAGTAREVAAYILRDMLSPEGAFISAEDADSPGGEGAFYVWTMKEIQGVLGETDAGIAAKVFDVRPKGNYAEEATGEATGANVLRMPRGLGELATQLGLAPDELDVRLAAIKARLYVERERRARPHKDDKVLADWNGLMVAALAKASLALAEPAYAKAAERAARFVLGSMRAPGGRLLHRFRDGEAAIPGNLDDHAFMAWGLLELYAATLDPQWLREADALAREMLVRFWDKAAGGLYLTPDDGERLLVRPKEAYDGALPSGNSVAAYVLVRLGRMLARPEYEQRAAEVVRAFSAEVGHLPSAHAMMLCALDLAVGPSNEVVVVGDPRAEDTKAMLAALRSLFLPSAMVLLRPEGKEGAEIAALAPYLEEMAAKDLRATAYVCTHQFCKNPTTDVTTMLSGLGITLK